MVFSRLTGTRVSHDKLSIAETFSAFHPDFILDGSYRVGDDAVMILVSLVASQTAEVILTKHLNWALTPSAVYHV